MWKHHFLMILYLSRSESDRFYSNSNCDFLGMFRWLFIWLQEFTLKICFLPQEIAIFDWIPSCHALLWDSSQDINLDSGRFHLTEHCFSGRIAYLKILVPISMVRTRSKILLNHPTIIFLLKTHEISIDKYGH